MALPSASQFPTDAERIIPTDAGSQQANEFFPPTAIRGQLNPQTAPG
jgi:hypothetical protein